MATADERLKVVVLEPDTLFGPLWGPINGHIGSNDYYRVPGYVAVASPAGMPHHIKADQIVRLKTANIPHERLHELATNSYFRVIRRLLKLSDVQSSTAIDRILDAVILPRGSQFSLPSYRQGEKTNIPRSGYYKIPPTAKVFVGPKECPLPYQIVRIIDDAMLKEIAEVCQAQYYYSAKYKEENVGRKEELIKECEKKIYSNLLEKKIDPIFQVLSREDIST